MNDSEVIKSFLVGLGFDIDQASMAKFYGAIEHATLGVGGFFGTLNTATGGVYAFTDSVSEGFENIGYQLRIVAPAINKFLILRAAMIDAYHRAGVNLTQAVRQSIMFNYELARTKFTIEAIYKSVAVKFFPLLTKQLTEFRQVLYDNMPKIREVLSTVAEIVLKAIKAFIQLSATMWRAFGRVASLLKEVDSATGGWASKIALAAAAWKLMSLTGITKKIGLLSTAIVGLTLLYDDFKVWQEGGKSFFNWSSAVPIVNALKAAVVELGGWLSAVATILGDIGRIIGLLFSGATLTQLGENFKKLFKDVKDGASDTVGVWDSFWNVVGAVGKWMGPATNWTAQNLGNGASPGVNMANLASPPPLMNPAASSTQNVSQKTDITITGVADAKAAGQHVLDGQGRVNMDLSRNLKKVAQ